MQRLGGGPCRRRSRPGRRRVESSLRERRVATRAVGARAKPPSVTDGVALDTPPQISPSSSVTVVLGLFQGQVHKSWVVRPAPPTRRSLGPRYVCPLACAERDGRPQKNRRCPNTTDARRATNVPHRALDRGRQRSSKVTVSQGSKRRLPSGWYALSGGGARWNRTTDLSIISAAQEDFWRLRLARSPQVRGGARPLATAADRRRPRDKRGMELSGDPLVLLCPPRPTKEAQGLSVERALWSQVGRVRVVTQPPAPNGSTGARSLIAAGVCTKSYAASGATR